jgi:hypothetical protein
MDHHAIVKCLKITVNEQEAVKGEGIKYFGALREELLGSGEVNSSISFHKGVLDQSLFAILNAGILVSDQQEEGVFDALHGIYTRCREEQGRTVSIYDCA